MKVLDATVLIAFLHEMDFPEGLRILARAYRLIVPRGVVAEIRKPPASDRLDRLIRDRVITVMSAPAERVVSLGEAFIELGAGERECVSLFESLPRTEGDRLVTDDSRIRKRVPGSHYVWTQELLRYMCRRGLLDAESTQGLLRRLESSTFYSHRKPDDHPAKR